MKKREHRYEGLSDRQIEVLNKFTQFRAASNMQKKMANILGDEKGCSDWIYYGYKDTGYFGGDKCSMGHTLRYVHYAKNSKTNEVIKFGTKCISDFFNITPDKLKMIKDGFVQTNKMVDNIVEIFRKGDYKIDEMKNKLLVLKEKPEHYDLINDLLNVGLPLPWQYDKEINSIWMKETSNNEFEKFLDNNPQYSGIIVMAQLYGDNDNFKNNHPILYCRISEMLLYLRKRGKLSQAQLDLLSKIILIDFDTIDPLISDLSKLRPSNFLVKGNYNEYSVFTSLVNQYNEWGLSPKQVSLLQKIHNRYLKEINRIKEQDLLLVE